MSVEGEDVSKRQTQTPQPETAEDPDGDYEGDDGE
jgi:hypothetical protein